MGGGGDHRHSSAGHLARDPQRLAQRWSRDQPTARVSDPRPPGDQRGDHGHLWLLHHDHCSRWEILLAVPCHCAHTHASSSSHWTLGSSDEGHVDEAVLDDEPDVDSRRVSKTGTPGAKTRSASGSEDGEDLGGRLLLHHQEHDHQGVWYEPAVHLPPGGGVPHHQLAKAMRITKECVFVLRMSIFVISFYCYSNCPYLIPSI